MSQARNPVLSSPRLVLCQSLDPRCPQLCFGSRLCLPAASRHAPHCTYARSRCSFRPVPQSASHLSHPRSLREGREAGEFQQFSLRQEIRKQQQLPIMLQYGADDERNFHFKVKFCFKFNKYRMPYQILDLSVFLLKIFGSRVSLGCIVFKSPFILHGL